jgi:hypothetical protein
MSTAARPRRSRAEQDAETTDLARRRALGQFFTPADVADFMWEMVEVLRKRRWHEEDTVIDPACGDGAFLRVAIERGQKRTSCYGLDIDETLAPVWRKDSLLRGARLFRGNGLENHPASGIVPEGFELVIGNPPFAGQGLKGLLGLLPQPGRKSKQARSLFGDDDLEPAATDAVENGGPIPAADRGQLERLARQLSHYVCWRLCEHSAEGEDPAEDAGGLFRGLDLGARRSTKVADYERMAKAIASTPADRPLNVSQADVRDAIRRMASTSIEVFFTERFVKLARPGGMIAVIVPESILASDQLGPLRLWLMQQVQLLAVVGLPHKVFTGVGANAKTGIIFARRYTFAEQRANEKAKPLPSGPRLAVEILKKPVFMASPNELKTPEMRSEYLGDVLSSVRGHHRNGTL